MKRNKINKPKEIECQICHESILAYVFSRHIQYKHINEITLKEYIEKFGEFRKNKLEKRIGKRDISKIQCKLCPCICSMVGMHTHLRDTHNMTVEQYIEQFGEYRPKQIKDKLRVEQNQIKCLICHQIFGSDRLLTYHIKNNHKISKLEYVQKYIFNNEIQVCKCGCGQRVKLLNQSPYKTNYNSGHNPKNNSN